MGHAAGQGGQSAEHPVQLAGVMVQCTLAGALYWPEQRLLVVSDLHFEKSTSRAAYGVLLPPYDTRDTLARLASAIIRYQPSAVICLGDSLHDPRAASRLLPDDRATLAGLMHGRDWLWIAGNHDPHGTDTLGGDTLTETRIGPLQFRHEAALPLTEAGEISGHYHPAATLGLRGARLRGRCFVEDGRRLIMPAFGAYTGGLGVEAPAYQPLFPWGFTTHLLGRNRIISFIRSQG